MKYASALKLIAALLGYFSGDDISAQSTILNGRVYVSGDTSRAVVGAEIVLQPGLRTVRSDSGGRFHFTLVESGSYTIRARRVGFEVAALDVTVDAQHPREVLVAMRTGAHVLSEITVAGHKVMFPARYASAYARVARGHGVYFTREAIDSLQPWDVMSLLPRIAGVRVNDRTVKFTRCQSGAVLGTEAPVHVYVDGVRATNYAIPGNVIDPITALKYIAISSVQLVEVYTGVSSIPAEYLDDACAVILVWTK